MAGGRCVQHTDGHCSCGTAQWPPYRTGHPTCSGGNVRSVTLGDMVNTAESLMGQLLLENNRDVNVFAESLIWR